MRRYLFPLFLLLLSHSVSAQKVIQNAELLTISNEKAQTVYYVKANKQPLQGEYRITKGLDETCISFLNGLMNGTYRRFRDGVLRESGVYSEGKRNGLFAEYLQDGTTISKITPMKRGKINGCVKTYYSNGRLASEKSYRQSIENGVEKRYDNQTGTQTLETHWVNGKKEGIEWKIIEQGGGLTTKTTQIYRNGVLHGAHKEELLSNGKPLIIIKGMYTNGQRSGKWTEHDVTTGKIRERKY